MLLFAATAGLLLMVSAVIPEVLGDAFDTLGRKHRYWPIFYLPIALIAALGFTALIEIARRRARAFAAGVAIVITGVAWASPVVASLALPTHIGRYPEIEVAMKRDETNLLWNLRELGPSCAAAVPQEVAREVFSFTGFRLVLWTGNWFGDNRARIRWADIYEAHLGSEQARIDDNRVLVSGDPDGAEWNGLVTRYGLDVIVRSAEAPLPTGATEMAVTYGDNDYRVLVLQECDA
jgi:hypothetical protein